jgi:hypothetical protein
MSREYHVSRRGAALLVIPSSLLCVLLWYTIPLILNLPCYQGYSLSIVPLLPRNNVVYITNRVSSSTSTTSMDRRRNHARYRVSRTMASFSKKEMTIPTTVPSFNSISSFIGKSTSTLVSLLCFATLAYKRNATMVSFFLGSIVNAVVAKVLKRIIKQQRPETKDPHDDDDEGTSTIRPTDNGMPSSHSMSLGFIGTFTYLGWGKKHSIVAPILLIYIITSLFYRVQAKLHTKEQVYVGVLFGGEKTKNIKTATTTKLRLTIHKLLITSLHKLNYLSLPYVYFLFIFVGGDIIMKHSMDTCGINLPLDFGPSPLTLIPSFLTSFYHQAVSFLHNI